MHFHLYNNEISYVIKIEKEKYVSHCYFGKKIRSWRGAIDMHYSPRGFAANPDRGDRAFSLDYMPQEYPDFGQGDFRSPAIELEFADGDRNTRFTYRGYKITKGKVSPDALPHIYTEDDSEAMSLEIILEDMQRNLSLSLYYTIYDNPVITRFASLTNKGNASVKIHRLLSLSMDLKENNFDILTLSGSHTGEKNIYRRPQTADSIVIESIRGTSSPQQSPFWGLLRKETNEHVGEAIGITLIYSGNFWGSLQTDQYGTSRVQLGLNHFQFEWELKPNKKFFSPEAVLVFSNQGIGGMSQSFHDLFRKRLSRGIFRDRQRPILLNTWEGAYFDVDQNKILKLAKKAKEAGIELIVLDDGWFKNRNDDTTSLGDWIEDGRKFPDGIQKLADRVRDLGLEFGIWLEPEMVSEKSDLYKNHPDWVIRSKVYEPIVSRQQLVLDLSNPQACRYIVDSISEILRPGLITYVKWDMNRHLTDLFSSYLDVKNQGELSHRYVLGLYSILEELQARFPNVLFENCSSGGGRFDAGMLYYMPQAWTSDNTDAIARLKIQYGTSILFPPISMGAHVSDVPNHQLGRVTPLKTRYAVAAGGNLGYELDLEKISDQEFEAIKAQVRNYKNLRHTIQFGDYYRLKNPFEENCSSWNFVSQDRKQVVFVFVQILAESVYKMPIVSLKGLDPDADYKDQKTGKIYGGDELMNCGIAIPIENNDFYSLMMVFDKL